MALRKRVVLAAADVTLAVVTTYLLPGILPVRRHFTVRHGGLQFDIQFRNFADAEKFFQSEVQRRILRA
jgi:hypothetical protein